jgi:hypothetical protein
MISLDAQIVFRAAWDVQTAAGKPQISFLDQFQHIAPTDWIQATDNIMKSIIPFFSYL